MGMQISFNSGGTGGAYLVECNRREGSNEYNTIIII
jgi:hypothetical protein